MSAPIRAIFVCSGNICRSPMAAALATPRLSARGLEALVLSAGTLNIANNPAAPNAVTVMAELGIDLSGHRSSGLSFSVAQRVDHLVVMAPEHEEAILARAPNLDDRIVRLWAYSGPEHPMAEIRDPVGLDLDAFRRCRDDLVRCLDHWVTTL